MNWELSQEELTKLGRAAGFDAIGATTADVFPELEPRLNAYAQRGLTGYECADVNQRIDPRAIMPQAQSLVAVAMAYLTPEGAKTARKHPPDGRRRGQMTVYSYGEDYHSVMRHRLEKLRLLIGEAVGRPIETVSAIDTSPLVDRRVAERAGIGWVGKNCLFYTEQHGSFVFLGTLLTDVRIEPAEVEIAPKCGSCTHCLDACPTGALLAPGVIDATRCLSYVTQMKGIIPEKFRAAMGRRVWGCDTCQWACPENKGVTPSAHEAYQPSDELAYPDLLEILTWSNRAFMRKYGHTAAAWRGLRTWQRNALIALGNVRDPESVPHIVPFLQHERPELRASAAWALRRIGTPEAVSAVAQAAHVETDLQVMEDMRFALDSQK